MYNMDDHNCPHCSKVFHRIDNCIGDYTELVGTEHDGCLLCMCPHCKEEVEVPQ